MYKLVWVVKVYFIVVVRVGGFQGFLQVGKFMGMKVGFYICLYCFGDFWKSIQFFINGFQVEFVVVGEDNDFVFSEKFLQ